MYKSKKLAFTLMVVLVMTFMAGCVDGLEEIAQYVNYTVEGKVTYNDSKIFSPASIYAYGSSIDPIAIETDSDGNFTLNNLNGTVNIIATFNDVSKEVTVTKETSDLTINVERFRLGGTRWVRSTSSGTDVITFTNTYALDFVEATFINGAVEYDFDYSTKEGNIYFDSGDIMFTFKVSDDNNTLTLRNTNSVSYVFTRTD